MVVPETDIMIAVNQEILEEFIAVTPDFAKYSGDRLNSLPPDAFGVVVATRKSDGDVCIIDEALWQQRMVYHFGH